MMFSNRTVKNLRAYRETLFDFDPVSKVIWLRKSFIIGEWSVENLLVFHFVLAITVEFGVIWKFYFMEEDEQKKQILFKQKSLICTLCLYLHWPICNFLQHLWNLWINCTQCYWYLWSRFYRAAQWFKRRNDSYRCSRCRGTTALYRGPKLLAGPQVPEFLTRLHGFRLRYIMAISLQNTLIMKNYTTPESKSIKRPSNRKALFLFILQWRPPNKLEKSTTSCRFWLETAIHILIFC